MPEERESGLFVVCGFVVKRAPSMTASATDPAEVG